MARCYTIVSLQQYLVGNVLHDGAKRQAASPGFGTRRVADHVHLHLFVSKAFAPQFRGPSSGFGLWNGNVTMIRLFGFV